MIDPHIVCFLKVDPKPCGGGIDTERIQHIMLEVWAGITWEEKNKQRADEQQREQQRMAEERREEHRGGDRKSHSATGATAYTASSYHFTRSKRDKSRVSVSAEPTENMSAISFRRSQETNTHSSSYKRHSSCRRERDIDLDDYMSNLPFIQTTGLHVGDSTACKAL